ncbi:MAG TPA: MFS transporter [Micropepsaceae bacterium]|nr:MFS transporter [Micropepsaceae bacterium]
MPDAKIIDVNEVIEHQKLGRFQIMLGALLLVAMFVDGFEAQAPGFAAPAIIKDWGIPRAAMGFVFGAGNLGLMLGAVLLGILGDRFGRKGTIVVGCLVLAVFSFMTMYATDLTTLRLLRIGSGIGVGGVLPSVIALGTEFSPKRVQATTIWTLLIGYQAGASSGALVSTLLFPLYGWQVMFLIGGILPIVTALLVLAFLPESVRFLALDSAARDRMASVLVRIEPRLRLNPDTRLIVHEEKKSGFRLAHLFNEGRAAFTLLLWAVYVANLMALQFLLTWLPTVLESATVPHGIAATATVLVPAGGIVGGLILSRFLDHGSIRPVAIAFALGVPLVALIGSAGDSMPLLMLATFGAGCAVIGGQTNLHAAAGRFYPTFIRANGIGWANGVGRVGSILGPVIGGVLIGLNLPSSQLFLFAAVPPLCAAIACFALARLQAHRLGAPEADLAAQPSHQSL